MKLLLILLLLLPIAVHAQAVKPPKRLTVSAGFGRTVQLTNKRFDRRQFIMSLNFSYRLSKRLSFNMALGESLNFKIPTLTTRFLWRIY